MHKFVRSLITEWRKLGLPVSDDTIVIGVSGGADSMSLMFALDDLIKRKKLSLHVIVAHLNHKLRGRESEADEQFVREQAEACRFEFVSTAARLSGKGNLEQNARDARYKFLLDTARSANASAVAVAHTQNDQAETFLINLIRGSGLDGLGAMQSIRELGDGVRLIRPLLTWATRSDTEAYCREKGVRYRTDSMNDDERFTRVRVRKVIMSMLSELNPRIVETLSRTARLLHGQKEDPKTLNDDNLTIADLKTLSTPELYSRLRDWLRQTRGNLRGVQLKHIEAVERLILSRKSGKSVELPGGGLVSKRSGRLTFSNIKVEK